jgi:hypothetical protein
MINQRGPCSVVTFISPNSGLQSNISRQQGLPPAWTATVLYGEKFYPPMGKLLARKKTNAPNSLDLHRQMACAANFQVIPDSTAFA